MLRYVMMNMLALIPGNGFQNRIGAIHLGWLASYCTGSSEPHQRCLPPPTQTMALHSRSAEVAHLNPPQLKLVPSAGQVKEGINNALVPPILISNWCIPWNTIA